MQLILSLSVLGFISTGIQSERVHNFAGKRELCMDLSSKSYIEVLTALAHLHNTETNVEVFPHTSLLSLLSATRNLQPLLVPHILLVEAHHHLGLIFRNNKSILHNGQK